MNLCFKIPFPLISPFTPSFSDLAHSDERFRAGITNPKVILLYTGSMCAVNRNAVVTCAIIFQRILANGTDIIVCYMIHSLEVYMVYTYNKDRLHLE